MNPSTPVNVNGEQYPTPPTQPRTGPATPGGPVPPAPNSQSDNPGGTGDDRRVTLGDVGPGRDHHGTPVRTDDGDTVVVLDWSATAPGMVQVWSQRHGEHRMPADTTGRVIIDPGHAATALRGALAVQVEQARALRADRIQADGRHRRVLAEIRGYAIDRHRDGAFCRDGLNGFLARFDLPRYEPRIRVQFTITGSYEIDPEDTDLDLDADAARRDAEENLAPNLDGLQDAAGSLIDGSVDYDVCAETETVETR